MHLALHDEPLRPGEPDLLGREGFVEALARTILVAPSDSSMVFAVYGPWGSGKTSLISLLETSLGTSEKTPPVHVIKFNPWLFSGRKILFEAFFAEVGSKMQSSTNEAVGKAGKNLRRLGMVLSGTGTAITTANDLLNMAGVAIPFASIFSTAAKRASDVISGVDEVQKKLLELKPDSPDKLFAETEKAIKESNSQILVILDDLDRLLPGECVEILQLVKTACRIPGIHFLILADQKNLVDHLESEQLKREYLDKIVQFSLPLPEPAEGRLKELLWNGLLHHLERECPATAASLEDDGSQFLSETIMPAIKTLRDVKRYLNVVRFSLPLFSWEGHLDVDAKDLLCLLLIHTRSSELYRAIFEAHESLLPPQPSIERYLAAMRRSLPHDINEPSSTWFTAKQNELNQEGLSYLIPALQHLVQPGISRDRADTFDSDRRLISPVHFYAYFRLERLENVIPNADMTAIFQAESYEDSLAALENLGRRYPFPAILHQLVLRASTGAQGFLVEGRVAAILRIAESNPGEGESDPSPQAESLLYRYLTQHSHRLGEVFPSMVRRSQAPQIAAKMLRVVSKQWSLGETAEPLRKVIAEVADELANSQDWHFTPCWPDLAEIWCLHSRNGIYEQWFERQISTPEGLYRMTTAFGSFRDFGSNREGWQRKFWIPTFWILDSWPNPEATLERLKYWEMPAGEDPERSLWLEGALEAFAAAVRLIEGRRHFEAQGMGHLLHPRFLNSVPASDFPPPFGGTALFLPGAEEAPDVQQTDDQAPLPEDSELLHTANRIRIEIEDHAEVIALGHAQESLAVAKATAQKLGRPVFYWLQEGASYLHDSSNDKETKITLRSKP